jgi:acylphosphatase
MPCGGRLQAHRDEACVSCVACREGGAGRRSAQIPRVCGDLTAASRNLLFTFGKMVNSVIAMTVTLAMTGYTIPGAPLVGSKRAAVAMGGFQQKEFSVGGARLSLIVGSSGVAPEEWPELCRDEGRTGVVYGLSDGRVEIVAEGERASLEALISKVHSSTPSEMVNLRETWQLPVGGYQAAFPVFILEPKMRADISLRCEDTGNLDYIARHSQIEAVFNRGLKLSKSREHPQQLDMVVVGDSGRLKSFVRWCYSGPPLARPDEVKVDWIKLS